MGVVGAWWEPLMAMYSCGDGVAQLVERRTQDPEDRGSNPIKSTRKNCEFFRVKKLMLC